MQLSFNGWINKQNVGYPYNRIVLDHEGEIVIPDKLWKLYVKGKKPAIKTHIVYDSIHMKV